MASSRIGNSSGSVGSTPITDVAPVAPGDAGAVPAEPGQTPGAGTGVGASGGWDAGFIAANAALQSTISTLSNHEAFKSLISSSATSQTEKKREEAQKELIQVAAEFKASEQKSTVKAGMLKASFLNSANLQHSAGTASNSEVHHSENPNGEKPQTKQALQSGALQPKKPVAERARGQQQGLEAKLSGGELHAGLEGAGKEAAELPQRGKAGEQPKAKQKQTEKQAQKEKQEQMARAKAKAEHAKKEAGEGQDNASKVGSELEAQEVESNEGSVQDGALSAEVQGEATGGGQAAMAQDGQKAARQTNVNSQKMTGQAAVEAYGADEAGFSEDERLADEIEGEEGAGVSAASSRSEGDLADADVAALGYVKDQHRRPGDQPLETWDELSEDGEDLLDNPLNMRRQARGDDKEIVDFLAAAGVDPNDPPEQQKEKVMRALKSLSPEESEKILGQLETHFGDNVARAQEASGTAVVAKPVASGARSPARGGNDRLANLEQKFEQNIEKQDRLANLLEKYIAADANAKVAQAESQERLIGAVIRSSPNYKPTYSDNPLSSQWTRSGSSGISLYEGRYNDLLSRQQGFQDVAGGVDHLSTPQTLNQQEAIANALAYEPRVTHADGANDYRATTRIVGELDALTDLTNLTVKLNTPRSV